MEAGMLREARLEGGVIRYRELGPGQLARRIEEFVAERTSGLRGGLPEGVFSGD